ncbi:MAG: aminotransferase class V-fold PLP-dependent enzyme [Acutalibacteraceae bacterium]|jgi:cysteine desulfurase family protein
MIYFDNAATTGVKPHRVIQAVKNALENYSANPGRSGHEASLKAAEAVFAAREKLADFFGAEGPENVVFTMNCTHAANCVLKGVLKYGDHVVVSSLEHNAVMRPLVKTRVPYSVAEVSLTDDRKTLANFERSIRPNTKLVFCTGASNVFGKILPIEKIGQMCFSRKILFAVDAAQTAGVLPIDMKKMNIDYLCIAPHKGLYAPTGVGVLIANRMVSETLIEGGTGTNSIELRQPDSLPERLESGTINVPGIVGTAAGIDYVNNIGLDKIYTSELNLISRLYRELRRLPQVQLYTPEPTKGQYAPLLSFNVRGIPSTRLADMLSEHNIAVRGGLHCAPMAHAQMGTLESGTVRVAVATFNTEREIDVFLSVLRQKILKI